MRTGPVSSLEAPSGPTGTQARGPLPAWPLAAKAPCGKAGFFQAYSFEDCAMAGRAAWAAPAEPRARPKLASFESPG